MKSDNGVTVDSSFEVTIGSGVPCFDENKSDRIEKAAPAGGGPPFDENGFLSCWHKISNRSGVRIRLDKILIPFALLTPG